MTPRERIQAVLRHESILARAEDIPRANALVFYEAVEEFGVY